MLFPPGSEQPTAPIAGILRLEPGAHHPEHHHGFAQVWFILKGAFTIDGRLCPPGTMLYHPDPHFEGTFQTATGGARRPASGGQWPMSRLNVVISCRTESGFTHFLKVSGTIGARDEWCSQSRLAAYSTKRGRFTKRSC
jgi:hypothetical protein